MAGRSSSIPSAAHDSGARRRRGGNPRGAPSDPSRSGPRRFPPLRPWPPPSLPASSHATASAPRSPGRSHPELRQPAEDLRYKAALARIEADRLSAREKAPGTSSRKAEQSEKEGIRSSSERDYDAAQMAFSRAARLFEQARDTQLGGARPRHHLSA